MTSPQKTTSPSKSKAALLRARQEELGKCRATTQNKNEAKECKNWAISEAGYCGQHYASVMNHRLAEERTARAKADLNQRIDNYLEWKKDHPSVWDR